MISGGELHGKSVVIAIIASDLLDFNISVPEKASAQRTQVYVYYNKICSFSTIASFSREK
ncbi:MAG: hypothetical protein DRN96_05270 [Thermoproteota archaeon]|nr:MAG: hypothetical protein DRN96_05270 [Candidatus Korarchaeota archaeon]